MQAMRDQIVTRIVSLGPGKALSAKDFLDVASRGTVDVTLGSLSRGGQIRRIRRGLYDVPRINPSLGGELSPDIDETAARAVIEWFIGRARSADKALKDAETLAAEGSTVKSFWNSAFDESAEVLGREMEEGA
jgi:hypothetical protein